MRIKRVTTVYTVLMLAVLCFFLVQFSRSSVRRRDIVYYNDLMYRIRSDISAGRDIAAIEEEYDCRLVFSKDLEDPELAELYSDEAFVLDLVIDGEYVGKAAWFDMLQERDEYTRKLFYSSLMLWAVTLVMGYAMFLVIYLLYVRPVDDLKKFSQELAKGNLDVSLPIRRANLFGSFTEAFDIMREELKASQKRRMEAEIARKELVASLSHDIKTPVAVIDATCEVLNVKMKRRLDRLSSGGKADGEEAAELADSMDKIGIISAKAGTIQTLITELLHTNLEDSGKAVVDPKEEYTTLIEEYFEKNRSFADIKPENSIPRCLVLMDRKRMEQVIDNIIGNSVKYAGTTIAVSFDEINDMMMPGGGSGSFIRIKISDSGPGVDEDDLPLIAQKYYRGKNAGEKSGFGMGLYLAKLYMQEQGGDMEYYNDDGFTVVLMLKKA